MNSRVENTLRLVSSGWGALVALAGVLAVTTGAFVMGKKVIVLPAQVDSLQAAVKAHDSTSKQQLRVEQTQLCITIADHQHSLTGFTDCLVKYGIN